MKRRLNEVYVKHTAKPYEVIEKTLDRDYFMTADQAKDFGLIDQVLSSREEVESMGCRWQDRLRLLDRLQIAQSLRRGGLSRAAALFLGPGCAAGRIDDMKSGHQACGGARETPLARSGQECHTREANGLLVAWSEV